MQTFQGTEYAPVMFPWDPDAIVLDFYDPVWPEPFRGTGLFPAFGGHGVDCDLVLEDLETAGSFGCPR
jgi:hypothetical protein